MDCLSVLDHLRYCLCSGSLSKFFKFIQRSFYIVSHFCLNANENYPLLGFLKFIKLHNAAHLSYAYDSRTASPRQEIRF